MNTEDEQSQSYRDFGSRAEFSLATLDEMEKTLESKMRRINRLNMLLKVLTITLGAIVATSGTASDVFGGDAKAILAFYAIVGIVITALNGYEAAFKLGSRGAALLQLTATLRSKQSHVISNWAEYQGRRLSADDVTKLRALFAGLDQGIENIQQKAAENGVSLPTRRPTIQSGVLKDGVTSLD